nr:aspartyl-phosphate phosphatase Spo0E family protein [Clostridium sp. SM-530-WT-3G]
MRIKIENLRRLMHEVIEIEENLLHWRVIEISQELDIVLNEYNRMLNLYV